MIKLLEDLEDTENEIICVFTVQEEVGSRGAGTAAYGLMPDIAVAIDVTNTGDTRSASLCPWIWVKALPLWLRMRTLSHPL